MTSALRSAVARIATGTADWPAPDPSNALDRPPLGSRLCSRPTCAEAAAVTLTYDYDSSNVWLDALLPERNPHCYDLCSRHAERLSVPNGWHLDDRRALPPVRLVS